jgi:hypothetical protein
MKKLQNITIIHYDDTNFTELWNSYLNDYNHTFSHTAIFQDYIHSYIQNIQNKSFILIKESKPLAIVPLYLEKIDGYLSFSLANSYIPIALYNNTKYEKMIFEYIHSQALKYKVSQIKISNFKDDDFNILRKYNFLETNNLNLSIDLNIDEKQLWTNLSKSYKSLINKYTKTTENKFYIMDKNNASWDIFNQYYLLHKEIAKEFARPKKLFQAQYKNHGK